LSTAVLEKISGVTGLSAGPASKNGCHWIAGALGVGYDVLPNPQSVDQYIALLKSKVGATGKATINDTALPTGDHILETVIPGTPIGNATLVMPGRLVTILVSTGSGVDPVAAATDLAKALDAVGDGLPKGQI
jgi:hypothetical protein